MRMRLFEHVEWQAQMESKITVLLVDDHPLVRRGFRRLLEDEDCIRVVGEADNGVRAVQMVGELNPRIVLMDCSMPGGDLQDHWPIR